MSSANTGHSRLRSHVRQHILIVGYSILRKEQIESLIAFRLSVNRVSRVDYFQEQPTVQDLASVATICCRFQRSGPQDTRKATGESGKALAAEGKLERPT
jgi:hypothetical protein